jgi:hypothetical protein
VSFESVMLSVIITRNTSDIKGMLGSRPASELPPCWPRAAAAVPACARGAGTPRAAAARGARSARAATGSCRPAGACPCTGDAKRRAGGPCRGWVLPRVRCARPARLSLLPRVWQEARLARRSERTGLTSTRTPFRHAGRGPLVLILRRISQRQNQQT